MFLLCVVVSCCACDLYGLVHFSRPREWPLRWLAVHHQCQYMSDDPIRHKWCDDGPVRTSFDLVKISSSPARTWTDCGRHFRTWQWEWRDWRRGQWRWRLLLWSLSRREYNHSISSLPDSSTCSRVVWYVDTKDASWSATSKVVHGWWGLWRLGPKCSC